MVTRPKKGETGCFFNHVPSQVVVHHRGMLKRRVLLSFLYTDNGQRIFLGVEGGGGVGGRFGLHSHASCHTIFLFLYLSHSWEPGYTGRGRKVH